MLSDAASGPFGGDLYNSPSAADSAVGFRCAYSPTTYTVTYNGAISGSVPIATINHSGDRVIAAANSGNLVRSGYTFAGWSTNASGTGQTYAAGGGTFVIIAKTTLYAKWVEPLDYSGLAGGTWVSVPGDSIYGTSDFCVQKYIPSDVSGVATSQVGATPWVSINQTDAASICSAVGSGYHLITNSEWMTIAAVVGESMAFRNPSRRGVPLLGPTSAPPASGHKC